MEKWILNNAAEVGVDLADFELPNDLNTLREQSKKMTTKNDQRFKNLFKELKRKEASGIMILQDWVSYLKENNYNANVDYFKD